MIRNRHAIAKARTCGQGATSRPNPTDETRTESNDEAGNARDGRTRGLIERMSPDDRQPKPDPESKKKNEAREEDPSSRQDESERAQARERHDTINRHKQTDPTPTPPPQTDHATRSLPRPGGRGICLRSASKREPATRGQGERERRKEKNMTAG